jgi:hypothetical protein
MDNSPVAPERQTEIQQMHGRVSIDSYILLAISAVLLLTAIVQLVSHLNGDSWLLSVVTVLFIVASLCCVAISAWRGAAAVQPHATRRSVSMSAALGSFLSGLFTIVFADDTTLTTPFIVIGVGLAIIALCIIGIIILMREEKTTRQVEPPVRRLPMETGAYGREVGSAPQPGISIGQSRFASQKYREPVPVQFPAMNSLPPGREPIDSPQPPVPITPQPPPGILNIMPSEVSGLRSLFEDDELYTIPRNTRARLFMLSKSNDILENCEDACDISRDETRFALCDGVSTSKFARPWARLLAEEWVAEPLAAYDEQALGAWLKIPRQRWLDWIYGTWFLKINDRNRSMGRVEFTRDEVEKFVKQGAAATFLGLDIDKATSTWSAVAVGDTCLFHFSRADSDKWKYQCFPLKQSSDFTDAPAFITTRPQSEALAASYLVSAGGEYKTGDRLVLATDALAMWLLTQLEHEQPEKIITLLDMMERGNDGMFARFAEELRVKKQLTDDDTTLIIINV